jgi:23S rRNA pseudouridine955/2504/2580 synthase
MKLNKFYITHANAFNYKCAEIQVEKEKEKNFELFVGNDRDDMRLDRFISTILRDKYMKRKDVKYTIPNHSLLEKLARKKKILVNGKPVKKLGDRVYAKDKVSLPLSAVLAQQTETHVPKEKKTIEMTQDQIYEVKSWVIFKNAEIIVINKPYGIAVQGGTGQSTHIDGMLRALRFEYEEDPKLVHRLDKDTSGVLVLARNREGAHRMAEWFQDRKLGLKKMYWAIVAGKPKPATGRIKMAMEKVRVAGGEKVFARDELEGDAKLSVTEYRTLDHAGEYISWLAMYPITGRLHQLRVHCSTALKCDIIGDYKYGVGCPDSLKSLVQDKGRVKMHLHARAMMLPYLNENGKRIVIKAPVPQHMAETMESFGFEESAGDKVAFKAK